jgi:uncharacterized alpha/beta hydrolase family protein
MADNKFSNQMVFYGIIGIIIITLFLAIISIPSVLQKEIVQKENAMMEKKITLTKDHLMSIYEHGYLCGEKNALKTLTDTCLSDVLWKQDSLNILKTLEKQFK